MLKRVVMGEKLAEAGYPDMSSAVRPMALSPDERYVYMQISFLHGFVEYDLETDKVLRVANLPLSEKAKGLRREQYVLDSAHHGLAMNPRGTKLCAAGTMSDYAAIVNRKTFAYKIVHVGDKPYWSTNSGDGKYCFVSVSGEDRVSVISYATAKEVASIPVGDHPQRMRMGTIRSTVDRVAPRIFRLKVLRRKGGRRVLRVRSSERARLRVGLRKARPRGGTRRIRLIRRRVRAGTSRVRLGRVRRTGRLPGVRPGDRRGGQSVRAADPPLSRPRRALTRHSRTSGPPARSTSMRHSTALAAALATAAILPAAAVAAPKPPDTLTLSATPSPVVAGSNVTLTGKMTGDKVANQKINLRADPFPFSAFSNAGTAVTNATGDFALIQKPTANTRYQASKGKADSPIVTVLVRPKVSLRLSDTTPAEDQRVRFSGRVCPEHDGVKVAIQRRSNGRFKTVRRATLLDIPNTACSSYARFVRVDADGRYRTVIRGHADHVRGLSAVRRVNAS